MIGQISARTSFEPASLMEFGFKRSLASSLFSVWRQTLSKEQMNLD